MASTLFFLAEEPLAEEIASHALRSRVASNAVGEGSRVQDLGLRVRRVLEVVFEVSSLNFLKGTNYWPGAGRQ